MIRFVFDKDDVLRTRFAISPLFEATASIAALQDPSRASIHLPFVRAARRRTRDLDLPLLRALIPTSGYTPDFISPPPESPLPDVEREIARVARTPAAQVRREVDWRFPQGPPDALRPLVEHPSRGLKALARELTDYWAAAFEPVWDRLRDVLEDDIAHRARLLTAAGPLEVFGDLHPDVRWHEGALEVDRPHEARVALAGRGLQLVPAAFMWPGAGAMIDPPWQPSLLYPPRGVGLLWEPAEVDDGALGAVIGPRRAAILRQLDREATTTALARRLHAGAPGISEHLGALRRAGLVRARRQGREVLYARTAAADALLRAAVASGP